MLAVQKDRNEIETFFDSVQDPEIRSILRLQYVDRMTQEQIAYELCYDERKYSLQGTTQGNGLTGGVPPVRFSM